MTSPIKYRCLGGYVQSLDGDRHYISSHQVQRLYNVPPAECIYYDIDDPEHKHRGYTLEFLNSLTDLWPRNDGNYELPKA